MADELKPLESEEDVDGILMLALRKQGSAEDDLRGRLILSAEEMGISASELAAAERDYVKQKAERAEFHEFRRRQVGDFREHFFTYIIVNTFLVAVDFLGNRQISWAMWPILGWGIGLAFHAWGSLNSSSDSFLQEFERFRSKSLVRKGAPRDGDA